MLVKSLESLVKYFIKYPTIFLEFFSSILLLVFCVYYFKSINKYAPIISIYVFATFLYELIGNIIASKAINNHLLFLVFFIVETAIFSIYYLSIIKNYKFKISIIVLLVITIAFFLHNIFNTDIMDDSSGAMQSISFIIISLICYYYILSTLNIPKLSQSPLFWINTGVLIYFSGKFFVSLFLTKVLSATDLSLSYIWDIMSLMIILFRIFLAIGISQTKHFTSQQFT